MTTIDGYSAEEWADNDSLYLIVGDHQILSNYVIQDGDLRPKFPEWSGDLDGADIIQK